MSSPSAEGDRVDVPALPDQLLAPLLETAGEILRELELGDVPASLRRLAGFDRRGFRTPAARQQLLRALEADDDFHARVVERFGERSEVMAALEGWAAERALPAVSEAAERADLPLLASALYADRPPGWAFGLGVAAAVVERQRVAREEEEERKVRAGELSSLEEARRRAEEARDAARREVGELEHALRQERQGRRGREVDAQRAASEAVRRVEELEAGLAKARASLEAAENRAARQAERARAVEANLRAARRDLATSEQAHADAEARLARSSAPGTGLRYADLQALTEAADLARRLAEGLGGVAESARGVPAPPDPGDTVAAPASTRPAPSATPHPARRPRPPVPAGMVADTADALAAMLQTPHALLVVDGYNVSMAGWADSSIADQRARIGAALARLHARTRCEVVLVFDGADVGATPPARQPGVKVVFSAPGEEADKVVVRQVAALSKRRPAIVASSDRWVQEEAAGEGAQPVSAETLLAVLRS